VLSAAKPGAGAHPESSPWFRCAQHRATRRRAAHRPHWLAGLCLCLVATFVGASEPALTVIVGGKTATHTASELLARADAATVTIPKDVAYGRSMTYRAVPLAALLPAVGSAATIRFTAGDGFATSLPAHQLLAATDNGARAWLAVEAGDATWPPLRAGDPTGAGPFYLVWTQPAKSRIVAEQWPYRITRIEEMPPLAVRFPAIVPAANVPADGPVNRGFATFTKNCIVCHTLNLAGDGTIGPDLNVPYNPTEYLRADLLRRYIRDPQSLRRWPLTRMPAFDAATLSDRELNDVVAYLKYMASRKVKQ
jgi:mono/diheme cytochrome c family protein